MKFPPLSANTRATRLGQFGDGKEGLFPETQNDEMSHNIVTFAESLVNYG